jgi:hypothetical protein
MTTTRIARKTRTEQTPEGLLLTITTVCDAHVCEQCETHAMYAAIDAALQGRTRNYRGDVHGATVRIRQA